MRPADLRPARCRIKTAPGEQSEMEHPGPTTARPGRGATCHFRRPRTPGLRPSSLPTCSPPSWGRGAAVRFAPPCRTWMLLERWGCPGVTPILRYAGRIAREAVFVAGPCRVAPRALRAVAAVPKRRSRTPHQPTAPNRRCPRPVPGRRARSCSHAPAGRRVGVPAAVVNRRAPGRGRPDRARPGRTEPPID
jgi:hypothetical protein